MYHKGRDTPVGSMEGNLVTPVTWDGTLVFGRATCRAG